MQTKSQSLSVAEQAEDQDHEDLGSILGMLEFCLRDVRGISVSAAFCIHMAINDLREVAKHGSATNALH
ncbi:MAG: hypothetical protein KDJ16_03385 [Hyphomicrobiales bacterium]|nr:hypothetical protein [Hyphomicrobiales bacterium]